MDQKIEKPQVAQVEYIEETDQEYKKLRNAYVIQCCGQGVEKSYFSTYNSYFLTNVFKIPALLAGVITMFRSVFAWVGNPIVGALIDRINFKKSKYYPWLMGGSIFYYLLYILLFTLPAIGIMGAEYGWVAFIVSMGVALFAPFMDVPPSVVFPLISTKPERRSTMGRLQKAGRDGTKIIGGYVAPALLVAATAAFGELNAYCVLAWLFVIFSLGPTLFYCFRLKGSYVEENALRRANAGISGQKKKAPLKDVIKAVFTNRPLLSIFAWKTIENGYYFAFLTGGTYMFKYVFNDFGKLSIYLVVLNVGAVLGALASTFVCKIFKDSKTGLTCLAALSLTIHLIIALSFSKLGAGGIIALVGCATFTMGMFENYTIPMFAAASDYGAWKSGHRFDGLAMSTYALSIKAGTTINVAVRTAILVAAGLDAVVAGAAVTTEFIKTLSLLWTWYPVTLAAICVLVLLIGYNLTDAKLAKINEDLKEGKSKATSAYNF